MSSQKRAVYAFAALLLADRRDPDRSAAAVAARPAARHQRLWFGARPVALGDGRRPAGVFRIRAGAAGRDALSPIARRFGDAVDS